MSKPRKVKKVFTDDPIQITAVKILRARLKEFYSHWPDPEVLPTPAQLHDLRISGKRLRYSAEQLREFYPDRLSLLIDLLKRSQDLLGEIQDCITQGEIVRAEMARLERRKSGLPKIAAFQRLLNDYDQRQAALFGQFREIWMGMAKPEFRDSLKAMVLAASNDDFPTGGQKAFQSNSPSE